MQIEQIAKEAHNELVTKIYAGHTEPFTPWLLEFAKLVAAKEREACAKSCENVYTGEESCGDWPTPEMCAQAIRARGEA